jgi:hypothetical protein
VAGDDKNAGADDGADAERYELPRTKRAVQLMCFFSDDFSFNGHKILLRAAILTVAWGCALLQHPWIDANQLGDIP